MLRVSALYPNTAGSHFDGAYYVASHTPFALELLGPHGLKDIRVTLGLAGMDGGSPPFWAISELIFDSRADFDAAMRTCGAALFADAANYTDTTPVLQISSMPDADA